MFTITFCKRLLTNKREVVVVQLELLDLMIRKECRVVSTDEATRADLIDLMARVLVAVFHKEGGRIDDGGVVQSQDQAGAPGSQSDRLPTAVQAISRYARIRKVNICSMRWPNGCVLWAGSRLRSSI